MDGPVADIARKYFNPRRWSSGTEQMAPLLYALIRMTRPVTVVEYGSGYTTLFLLQALADNVADFAGEREDLVEKTRASGLLERGEAASWNDQSFRLWFGGGGRASAADPAYYLDPYTPHLYCFENKPVGDRYAAALMRAVAEAGLDGLFSLHDGNTMSGDDLPAEAKPIDLVWWDFPGFDRCYRLFWPILNPDGGMMIWHDVASGLGSTNWKTFRELTASPRDDLEALVLFQPNKLDQNSCAILRRTASYAPPFARAAAVDQLRSARELVNQAEHAAAGSTTASV